MNLQSTADAVRDRLANSDNESSVAARMRQRRTARLVTRFPSLSEMAVLDLGGTVEHWEHLGVQPRSLTIVNIFEQHSPDPTVTTVCGDACTLPDSLNGAEFDLVYSNSVLEHVGGAARRSDMAEVVASAAPHHWVQTPYRYFPIEPHWLFPGFQLLPVPARVMITERWPVGYYRGRGRQAVEEVLSTELIGRTEMAYLFPDSDLVAEKVLGFTKSLIAAR